MKSAQVLLQISGTRKGSARTVAGPHLGLPYRKQLALASWGLTRRVHLGGLSRQLFSVLTSQTATFSKRTFVSFPTLKLYAGKPSAI